MCWRRGVPCFFIPISTLDWIHYSITTGREEREKEKKSCMLLPGRVGNSPIDVECLRFGRGSPPSDCLIAGRFQFDVLDLFPGLS